MGGKFASSRFKKLKKNVEKGVYIIYSPASGSVKINMILAGPMAMVKAATVQLY